MRALAVIFAAVLAGCGGAAAAEPSPPAVDCTLFPDETTEAETNLPLYITDAGLNLDGAALPDGWSFVPPFDEPGNLDNCGCGVYGPAPYFLVLGLCGAH